MINGNKFNTNRTGPRILVAPLDWGLGHATRCIPIINELIKHHCEVIIAADEGPFFLLKKEFPTIVFLRLKGYKIQYSHNRKWLSFKLLLQFPKIIFFYLERKCMVKKNYK